MNTIGDRIRLARVKAGLSQRELGKRCNLCGQAVWAWEEGLTKSPTIKNICKAAHVMGVSVASLTTGEY